ncbi:hypothetical protein G7Y79_00003g011050 [Physcia stellaris]|nr:hypothetical protein G7Y79_00003g011050 [Physcia stellaris]
MKYAVAVLALAASVSAQTPPGCSENFSGTFEISPINATTSTKRGLLEARALKFEKRAPCTNTPVVILKNGILTDQNNRQGEVVANQQFQFDTPLQPDALFTSGFSICANGSLAIGGSAIFYSCKSGSFSNLYHESQGGQCDEVFIDTHACDSPSGTQSAQSASLTSSASTSSSSTLSTTSAPTTTPTVVAPIPVSTPATIIPPFPAGNATSPSATATGSAPVTTTSKPASTTSPAAYQPSNGAGILSTGCQFLVAAAGVAAFAMF